jgi:hypothetical protein
MGDDGRRGAQAIRASGGRVIAESEETAVIFGMPQQVIRCGAADRVLPLDEIARAIQRGIGATGRMRRGADDPLPKRWAHERPGTEAQLARGGFPRPVQQGRGIHPRAAEGERAAAQPARGGDRPPGVGGARSRRLGQAALRADDRIASLEEECTSVRERLDQVELENSQFAQRYVEVEEENNNLANLYVSSYQLHSTLDLDEVIRIITEIVINLIGAEVFAVYLIDGEGTSSGRRVGRHGVGAFPKAKLGVGVLGKAVASERGDLLGHAALRRPHAADRVRAARGAEPADRRDRGARPARAEGRLLRARPRAVQHAGRHAATAIFAAKLYSQSERKLNTIQGFIDLLTK